MEKVFILRLGIFYDIGNVVLFFLSDVVEWIIGVNFLVDGGMLV